MPTVVMLTGIEMAIARYIGKHRFEDSRTRWRHSEEGCAISLEQDIEAAAAEMAAAKAINAYWAGPCETFKAPDIEPDIQVRHAVEGWKRLIIRPRDDAGCRYVLVTGASPVFTVHGWITKAEACRQDWMSSPNSRKPVWFVPQWALHDCQGMIRRREI